MTPFRYGHCDGHTDLCYSDDSESFITCGNEGDVRVWKDINDTDQKDLCVGEKAWAVCQRGKSLYVGTDKNIIQALTFPELEVNGIITRFTAPVTHIDLSADEKILAAGSCNMEIDVIEISDLSCTKLSGHNAPILSISLDPQRSYLASSSCDGSVRVWDIKTKEAVHIWKSFLKESNSFEQSTTLCRLQFEPNSGRFLAVPKENNIHIYERDTWSLMKTLTHTSNEHAFNVVRYSKCKKYIAGGTVKGFVYIFEIASEKVVAESSSSGYDISQAITAISWHSNSLSVVFCNMGGQIAELLLSSGPSSSQIPETVDDLSSVPLGVPDFEDDDEDSENVISLEKIKAESGFGPDRASPARSLDDKEDKESIISERPMKYEPKIPFSELQEPFQPSSTPIHLQERFLLWNNVGIVRGFNREECGDELDIEFHDTTVHHGFRMSNTSGYSMAALTQQAVILAAPRLGEMPSKICCVLLKAWDGQKEWEAGLGTEDIVGLAAGRNWIAVVTDRFFLRLYSVDGTQTDILSLPGPLISLTGHDNKLAVYFHSAQGRDRDQYISYMLMTVDAGSKLATVYTVAPLPTHPTSVIKWVGFSDEGSPATLDSEGFLRLLYNKQWRPICSLEDRAKGKFDHYFVVGLSEKTHTVRCILCKGAYYPPVIPKPIVNEIQWQIPLSDLDTDKGKLEEEMLKAVITLPNLQSNPNEDCSDARTSVEKTISVTIMKLFALACRTGLEGRAVSLCESMPSVDVVKLASKYAAKLGRHQLANRVSDVALRMTEVEIEKSRFSTKDRDDHIESDNEEDHPTTVSSSSRNQDGSSQDIFADHDTSITKNISNKFSADKENLIMKMRKKKFSSESLEPKPSLFDGKKSLYQNPFKSVVPKNDDSSNSLDQESTPRPNYIEWFNKNKSVLQSEHPLLTDTELAIIGMKNYRQIHNTNKGDSATSSPVTVTTPVKEQEKESAQIEESGPKKRKLSDIMNDSKKKLMIENEKKSPSSEKKPLIGEKKPSNASSKLKNFSFVKKSS